MRTRMMLKAEVILDAQAAVAACAILHASIYIESGSIKRLYYHPVRMD